MKKGVFQFDVPQGCVCIKEAALLAWEAACKQFQIAEFAFSEGLYKVIVHISPKTNVDVLKQVIERNFHCARDLQLQEVLGPDFQQDLPAKLQQRWGKYKALQSA